MIKLASLEMAEGALIPPVTSGQILGSPFLRQLVDWTGWETFTVLSAHTSCSSLFHLIDGSTTTLALNIISSPGQSRVVPG